ncbi:helix-turn-helix domain-containing protein [Streptomyces sp. URMC 124]|uniref:helix-turn-helix domain-containing protein n=1 Tax=Streptomyces sp. URMC 124 TaxID=3423405 RepID=UPI003F19AC6E
MTFGVTLRERRLEQGLSLAGLSKTIHYSKGHLSRIESGDKRPSEDLARRCDEALGARGELLAAHRALSTERSQGRTSCPPFQLPPDPRHFTGRHAETAELDALAALPGPAGGGAAPVVLIDGKPGVGKTALALRWAHRNAASFPDGVLFHDLGAYGPAGSTVRADEALAAGLRALGVEHGAQPADPRERAALHRSVLAGRSVLVVLDNAASADDVRTLLPGTPGCTVLVTSRSRMAGLVARDGAARLSLRSLSLADSSHLLARTAGPGLRDAPAEAVSALAERCGLLPLALRIAAERLSAFPPGRLDAVVRELDAPEALLDFLHCPEDPTASVRSTFSWSYARLEEDAARAFRLLGPRAGAGMPVRDAADVLGVPPAAAARLMEVLHRNNLLELTAPGRYLCDSLLGAYAAELAGESVVRDHRPSGGGTRTTDAPSSSLGIRLALNCLGVPATAP